MRILIVHNRYQQPGGEDAVASTEFDLLKGFGQEVRLYERGNDEIKDYSLLERMNSLWKMGWSEDSYNDIRKILKGIFSRMSSIATIFSSPLLLLFIRLVGMRGSRLFRACIISVFYVLTPFF